MDFRYEPWGLENGFDILDEVSYNYLKNSDALIPLPIERLRKMNPRAISLYLDHGIDITKEPLKVAVCAQHNNGGVRIDSNWQTNVTGLYTAGEAAGSLGIFRPGGSALNSCQVGSMRAAEHIVYQSKNTVSENFDAIVKAAIDTANELIEKTKSETSTLKTMRNRYGKRMSRDFAFLRDISVMSASIEEIGADIDSFSGDNLWKEYSEIPALFKNLDIIRMQEAVAATILYTAKEFGSRGSGYVLDGTDFMDRLPVAENTDGRGKIVTVNKSEGISARCVPVRPIPTDRDLWFERVWNKYNSIRG